MIDVLIGIVLLVISVFLFAGSMPCLGAIFAFLGGWLIHG